MTNQNILSFQYFAKNEEMLKQTQYLFIGQP